MTQYEIFYLDNKANITSPESAYLLYKVQEAEIFGERAEAENWIYENGSNNKKYVIIEITKP